MIRRISPMLAVADMSQTLAFYTNILGMTEFHISDPNDCLVFVGQPTKPNKTEQGAAANT